MNRENDENTKSEREKKERIKEEQKDKETKGDGYMGKYASVDLKHRF